VVDSAGTPLGQSSRVYLDVESLLSLVLLVDSELEWEPARDMAAALTVRYNTSIGPGRAPSSLIRSSRTAVAEVIGTP